MILLIVVFSFLSVFLLISTILKYFAMKNNSVFRIKKYINMEELREEKKKETSKELKFGLGVIARRVGDAQFLDGYKKKIQMQLNRAHILLKAEEFITLCMVLFTLMAFTTFVATSTRPVSQSILMSIPAGIVGWLLPHLVVRRKIKKRIKQLNDQLNDAIVLMSNSLKAGYSFFQAVDTVVKEMDGAISDEFSQLQKEVNIGLSTEKAFENLVKRIPSDDLELLITAVLIQRQVGGNLAEILDSISSTIRDRIKIKGEIKTLTAQGRMSGLIIALLPPVLGFIIYLINPAHMSLLFTNPVGIGIIVFSVIMELIGILFIKKIVNIEV